MKNVGNAKEIVRRAAGRLKDDPPCSCRSALKDAIITNPKAISDKTRKKLSLLIGKYIK